MNQILATENEKNNHNKEQKNSIPQDDFFEPINDLNTQEEPINNFENIYEPPNYSEENNYFSMDQSYQANSYSTQSKTPIDSKKIIIFFAIVIIVFGLAIGGVIAFKMIKENQIKNSKPEVGIEQIEGNVKLSAFCKKGINKIIYYWDEDEKTEIPSTGENVEKLITLPKGENTLTVILVDKNGDETTYTENFTYYTDKERPVILDNMEIVEIDGKKYWKIVVEDETEIKSLNYQIWEMVKDVESDKDIEGELLEEETIYPEQENSLTIEANIEIKRGKQKLKIVATDTSNNTVVKEIYPRGTMEPEIEFWVQNEYLYMVVAHDIGVKKIIYTINGKEYTFDENTKSYEDEKTQVRRKKKLKEGENTIEVMVYTLEEEDKPYPKNGKYTYTPSN